MSKVSRYSLTKSIVLLGKLNPAIFQPAWFSAHSLIRETEADVALKVIHPDVALFDLQWAKFDINPERFVVTTEQEPYFEVVRDLVLGTFRLLEHTPIKAIGFNTTANYKVNDREDWDQFGHSLAPKDFWNSSLSHPGLVSLTIQGEREDEYKGYIRVTTGPISKPQYGVQIAVNDHFEPSAGEEFFSHGSVAEILASEWGESCNRAEKIIGDLIGRV